MALTTKWLERRRLEKAAPFLQSPVLDLGCGRSVAFKVAPDGYVGIDVSRDTLHESSCPQGRILQASADGLPFGDETFRTVLMMAVVEHLPDPYASIAEALRVLQRGGWLVITTPTPHGDTLHHTLAKLGITSKHAADEHQMIFNPDALAGLLRKAGAEVVTHRRFLLGGNQVCVAMRADGVDGRAP